MLLLLLLLIIIVSFLTALFYYFLTLIKLNKMKELLIKFWKILDGNKTWICTTVLFILQLPSVNEALHPDLIIFLNYVFGIGGGASLVHHIYKGKLTETEN